MRKVIFLGQSAAENMPPDPDWAVISITSPGEAPARLQQGFYTIYRVQSHDGNQENGRDVLDAVQAADLVDFVHSVEPCIDTVLVHCGGGICRSAAVARWIAETFDLEFRKDYTQDNKQVLDRLRQASERRKRRLS